MIRKGIYPLHDVFDWADTSIHEDTENNKKDFDGLDAMSGLLGYKVFKHKGTDCRTCEVKGEYFALEKTPGKGRSKYNNWHFNLYGKDKFGREVMLTKDHIKAKSNGGSDDLENLQPMCMTCNTKKGSMFMKEFEAKRQGKQFNWDLDHANHVIKRMQERYSLSMTLPEYGNFLNQVREGAVMVHTISNSKSYRKVKFKDTEVFAMYSSMYSTIYTVIDPNTIEKRMMDVPTWGKGKEKECLEAYANVMDTIKSQFKELETEKETALYLGTCKYKKAMFAYWKKNPYRVNILVWHIVKTKLNLKEETEVNENS